MTVEMPPEPSRYEMLSAVSPQLLNQPADASAVSLLGQAVSDVLDHEDAEATVDQMIADLESARASAISESIHTQWAAPLAALLGLLRQHQHNRTVQAAAFDPDSLTLRDKVLAALDAGVDTPTAIGEYVYSPTTVVSRVLRGLVEEGRVEKLEPGEDKRRRPYRRVEAVTASEKQTARSKHRAGALADANVLIDFAEALTRFNPRHALTLLPDLIAAGADPSIDIDLRVWALSVAGVIVRSSEESNAGEDALDLAETSALLASRSREPLLLSRAAYDRARAFLFALPQETDTYMAELDLAEKHAKDATGDAAQIRLAWCAYTRCLVFETREPARAVEYAQRARELFEAVNFGYGVAAALTALTRASYACRNIADTRELALQALSRANSGGYLRLMAESSFWAGQLLIDDEPEQAQPYFTNAAEYFHAVGSDTWSALSYASSLIANVQWRGKTLPHDVAESLLGGLRQLQEMIGNDETPWAAAILQRRMEAVERLAGKHQVAKQRV